MCIWCVFSRTPFSHVCCNPLSCILLLIMIMLQGFLKRCRDYSTLFDSEKVETIFSNVEEIYRFQRDFLRELESKVDRDRMDCSEIGSVFVINVSCMHIHTL